MKPIVLIVIFAAVTACTGGAGLRPVGAADERRTLVPVPEVVGTWYLHVRGLLRQYTFYEGGTYEAYEGTLADLRYTTGHYTYSEQTLTLRPEAGGERVSVGATVHADTLTIAPGVDYLALDVPLINPPRLVGEWHNADYTLTFRADATFTLQREGQRRRTEGTYTLVCDPAARRLLLRVKEGRGKKATTTLRTYPARLTDHDGRLRLRIDYLTREPAWSRAGSTSLL